jgi:hypothetical protein
MPHGVTRVFNSNKHPRLDWSSYSSIEIAQASTPWAWALTQWH